MESLERQNRLTDQTYDVILDALCDGTFKSGERVTQEDIAARLNVSRQPVTHALAILKAQGFLVASGRRGLIVSPVEPKFFENVYQIRAALEPLAVRLAAKQMTKSLILRGRSLVEHGRNLVIAGDARAVLQADVDFHSLLYEASGNPLIGESLKLHWRHLRRAMGEVLNYPGLSISVWQEHSRIVEAMIRGEGDVAGDLMRAHVLGAYERVARRSEPSGSG